MLIRAGELRERIVLVGAPVARDADFGGEQGSGPDIATVYAKIMQTPGGQVKTADQLSGVTGITFVVRFREDLSTAMFVRHRLRLLNISSIAEIEHRRFQLIVCQARDGGAT